MYYKVKVWCNILWTYIEKMTKIHIYLDRVFKSVLIHTQVEEYILCRADHCLEGLYIDHPFYLDPKLLVLYISK